LQFTAMKAVLFFS